MVTLKEPVKGLSNKFLEEIGSELSPFFEGVWPCDLLLKSYIPKSPSSDTTTSIIFCNTADSTTYFGHFLCLVFEWKSKTLLLLDSLAIGLLDSNIAAFLIKFKKMYPDFKIQVSPYPIQHPG